eukprot:scaffold2783_cov129-Cylindrotheca_fusiformis.AAC.19
MVVSLRDLPLLSLALCSIAEGGYYNSQSYATSTNDDTYGNSNQNVNNYIRYSNQNTNDANNNYDDDYSTNYGYGSNEMAYNSTYNTNLYSNLVAVQMGSEAEVAVIENCARSTVWVNSVTILCDSPYAYSYGNGAHRGSTVCDYGDMATVMVNFNIAASIRSLDNVYMTMGVYATKVDLELLFAAINVHLNDLVGRKVNKKGNYEFSMRIMLDKTYGDNAQFVPGFEFGFSTMQDEGYNLGGVNINCAYNAENQPYSSKFYRAKQNSKQRYGAGPSLHYASFSFFLGVALVVGAFYYFWRKRSEEKEIKNAEEYDEENKAAGYIDARDIGDDK